VAVFFQGRCGNVAERAVDIGVAQQNKRHLDFRAYNAQTGAFEPIVLPLLGQDGAIPT
jgi:hypothetical protein